VKFGNIAKSKRIINIQKLEGIDKCGLHCGKYCWLDGMMHDIGSLDQWEVVDPLGVLMMSDHLQWLVNFNFVLINRIWSVDRNRLFHSDGHFYCVGFGYE